jgi:multidrug efflux pump
MKNKFREFAISSWAIDNRTAIYLLTIIIVVFGAWSYKDLPKENFPEIQWPVIYVSVPYPGTSPEDIEKLVCKKIEKEVQSIEGIKEINSTSIQDFGNVFVEFETDVDIDEAKRDVQEAVNRAKGELPSDLPNDPQVIDIDLSQIPIMFVNLSGPYDKVALKDFAEDLQEEIEDFKEIRRVDIVGALEQEVKVDLDLFKMQASFISFGDVEKAISGENVIISGGEVDMDNQKVAVRVNGEFQSVSEIENLVIKSGKGNTVFLRDIASVTDGFKDQESYARLNGEPVITLNVIKKAGENLIDAADEIKVLIAEMEGKDFPEELTVTISGDQSMMTRNTLNELTNTIIIGFILVTLVLMFFMGVRDALFVGLAVPISSMIAFAVIPFMGFSLNLVVLFTFILAMGIVVDNAIVVIENTYRIFTEEGLPIVTAAKKAAGEVIAPVFSGTLTTIAPFTPLLIWPGSTGEFMSFLPVTMIITLVASLFVAYVINPVFAVSFMKKHEGEKANYRKLLIYTGGMALLSLVFHLLSMPLLGNLMLFMIAFVWFNALLLNRIILWFQEVAIPALKGAYRGTLRWSMNHSGLVMLIALVFLMGTGGVIGGSQLKVIFFPESDPNFVYVYNELPVGTNVEVTDSVTRTLEARVAEVITVENPNVKSMVTNIAIGAGDGNSFDQGSPKPNKGKITIEFVETKKRSEGFSTREVLEEIRKNVRGIPGAKVVVDKEQNGPPVGAPVELLLTSEDFDALIYTAKGLITYLDSVNVPGVEELKWDADAEKSELLVNVDRVKASELGITSMQIGTAIRTAVFGKEASKFRPDGTEDEYDITLRLADSYRDNLNDVMSMNITFMDQSSGMFKSIPISAVADMEYSSSYGSINRTDLEKSITISSNVLDGYNPTEVNEELAYWIDEYKETGRFSQEVNLSAGGETEEQAEQAAFLSKAFLAAIALIFLILVTQFNSLINVLIILSQVLLSIIGAMLGITLMGMDFSIVMNGVGIVALAGIVVNNGIILLDFIQHMEKQGTPLKEAVVEGSTIRFTPVLLTASSTILGLVPLALSMNINFETLITQLDPQIFFGGDSASFWGPLSWTIIWGLGFATVITLVFVPVLYYVTHRTNQRILRWLNISPKEELPSEGETEYVEAEPLPAIAHGNGNGNGNGNGVKGHREEAEEVAPEVK